MRLRRFDLGDFLWRQTEGARADDAVELLGATRADDRASHLGPPEGPGDSDLTSGAAVARADFLAAADADGRTAERFELVYLIGWAPDASQPVPARRGSATASLAAALQRRD